MAAIVQSIGHYESCKTLVDRFDLSKTHHPYAAAQRTQGTEQNPRLSSVKLQDFFIFLGGE
jgi:hypothetical protein